MSDQSINIQSLTINLGDVLILDGTGITVNFDAQPGEPVFSFGSLTGTFGSAAPSTLTGKGIAVTGLGFDADLQPIAAGPVSITVQNQDGLLFGLPAWLPFNITGLELKFNQIATDPTDISILVSADVRPIGLPGTDFTIPVTGDFVGVEVNLRLLKDYLDPNVVDTPFPITGISGVTLGIEPVEIPLPTRDPVVGGGGIGE